MKTTYDSAFFEYVNSGAIRSARGVLPLLNNRLEIRSVLDAGCGQGAWLKVWGELGCSDRCGVDGDYVDRDHLLIPPAQFQAADLSRGFDVQRRFDLAQCLEVGEHLPPAASGTLVDSLVRHADVILFSAAAVGQGGDQHVNECPYDFWRSLFAKHGYVAIDFLRPAILENKQIEPWYRYNSFLYVRDTCLEGLHDALARCRVPDTEPLRDLSPGFYKLRKQVVRRLPVSVATKIAKRKEAWMLRRRLRHRPPDGEA